MGRVGWFWGKMRARRSFCVVPSLYLSSTCVSASAPTLTVTRMALKAPFALLRSKLARPILVSIERVASVTQRSPTLCALVSKPTAHRRLAKQNNPTDCQIALDQCIRQNIHPVSLSNAGSDGYHGCMSALLAGAQCLAARRA